VASEDEESHGAVRRDDRVRCFRRRPDLLHQRNRSGQLAGEEADVDALGEREGKFAEGARLAGEPYVALRDQLPPRVVPEVQG
jgi:hypothetical protein